MRNDGYTFHVPEGCYLMLGDNRNNSSDARYWAQKALENIPGISDEEAESLQYVKRSQILRESLFPLLASEPYLYSVQEHRIL